MIPQICNGLFPGSHMFLYQARLNDANIDSTIVCMDDAAEDISLPNTTPSSTENTQGTPSYIDIAIHESVL